MDIRVIYEDEDVIVVYKPQGVATQTSRLGQKDMESLLKNYRAKKGESPYIGVVHRLDQPVEGVMVFAKTPAANTALSKQVQERSIGKYYYAVVKGQLDSTEGTLTDYMTYNGRTNLAQVVKQGEKNAKKAELSYKVMAQRKESSLVDICLKTGRHHQIRLQMSHNGNPLLGDGKYGDNDSASSVKRTTSIALCSYRIQFKHPVTQKEMDFKIVPEGKYFQEFINLF